MTRMPRPRLLPLTIAAMAALLLVKSAVLVRAAVPTATPAAASTPGAPTPSAPTPIAPPPPMRVAAATPAPAAAVPPPPDAAAPAACPGPPVSESERKLLLDLRHRRAELDAREAALSAREGVLSAAEKRMADRVTELTGLQQRLEALDTARKAREEANWQGLVKVYEAMKPRDAATIFNDLDKNVLLQVLDRMNARKAAPVLAAMEPDRARKATAELARMRAERNRVPAPAAPAGG